MVCTHAVPVSTPNLAFTSLELIITLTQHAVSIGKELQPTHAYSHHDGNEYHYAHSTYYTV